MAADPQALLADLQGESDDLDRMLAAAPTDALAQPTPAAGWTIGDTLGHLWFFDREGTAALEDPEDFTARLATVMADPESFLAGHLEAAHELGDDLLPAWRAGRHAIIAALRRTDPGARVPWYGPPMSPMSFATARLMETWAHGQDIADALGVTREPTDRLRHIAHLGVRTRGFSYAVKGREAPDVPVYVELVGPSGATWEWGEPDARDTITGTALDFCLLVTQRRLPVQLGLSVTGPAAEEWVAIAQAFAGGPSVTDPARTALD